MRPLFTELTNACSLRLGSPSFQWPVNPDVIDGVKIRSDQSDPFSKISSCTMVKKEQMLFLGGFINKLI